MTSPHIVDSKPDLETLTHFGVKGMHWGQRMAKRKELRSLDKASKAADHKRENAAIDAARRRVGSAREDYVSAKNQYKTDKNVIGKREAAKKFNKVKARLDSDAELSMKAKHGKETTATVLALVGGYAVKGLITAITPRS